MARVFLSYAREDVRKAEAVATALQQAGHQVWWDPHLVAGAEYSRKIDAELAAADAVVVLWSRHAIDSPWVRDEAAAGRDSGRLVPVRLGKVDPPLGFRQYQTLDLSRWRGDPDDPALGPLIAAVGSEDAGARAPGQGAGKPGAIRWSVAAPLILLLIALIAGGLWLATGGGRTSSGGSVAVAAVVPADASPTSRDYARDLLAKLGRFQATKTAALELVGTRREDADLLFEVGGVREGSQLRATVVLADGGTGALLWSKDFEQPRDKAGDLRQQLGFAAAKVLQCALDARAEGGAMLRQQTFRMYLNGCSALAEGSYESLPERIRFFRQVVRAAPDSQAAWAHLIAAESFLMTHPAASGSADRLRQDLVRDLASARKLDPHMAAGYAAEVTLLPPTAYERSLQLVDTGIEHNPDDPGLRSLRAFLLFSVGRVSDALEDQRRAVELDPIAPWLRERYIQALAGAGRLQLALKELEEAEQLWPGSSLIADVRRTLHIHYGDPRAALDLIRSSDAVTAPATESFVRARLDPSPANVNRAVSDAWASYRRSREGVGHLIQVLATFDRTQELLRLVESLPVSDQVDQRLLLFRSPAQGFWRDPSSLQYARRIGLLQYWRSSGQWPDFCHEEELPYDCNNEAVRLLGPTSRAASVSR